MKVIYAGYREWSFKIAKSLLKNKKDYSISAVITTKNPESNFRLLRKKTYEIDPRQSKELKKILLYHSPDVVLFYGWSWMIPQDIYEEYICLIYHISPLPKYRGGSPIQHQIINGEKMSAGTILRAIKEVDAGPIYSQSPISLEGNMNDIFKRIIRVGSRDTKKVLQGMALRNIQPKMQNEKEKTVLMRRKPEDSEIKPEDFKNKTAEELYNFIRALADPYPNAFIRCKNGEKLLLKSAEIEKNK